MSSRRCDSHQVDEVDIAVALSYVGDSGQWSLLVTLTAGESFAGILTTYPNIPRLSHIPRFRLTQNIRTRQIEKNNDLLLFLFEYKQLNSSKNF